MSCGWCELGGAMSTRLSALDENHAIDTSERRRIAGFVLLGDYLASEAPAEPRTEAYEQLWAAAADRSAVEFVRQGTPFFWKNVSRCLATAAQSAGSLGREANYFLRTGFDSYFDWLPDGAPFSLGAEQGADLVLPRLGVRIPAASQSIVARRLGPRRLEVELTNRRMQVDLDDIDPGLRLPVIDVDGHGAKLLLAKDPTLFEDSYIDKISPETSESDFMAKMIAKSLEMIQAANPELASDLKRMIRWYVPMTTPGPRTHNSMSVNGMRGVIFLSEAYDDIRMAEAIVHEYYHNELYLFQEEYALHEEVPNEVLYSPWRPDPRPLNGLLHASYVFSGVADFLSRAERLPELSDYVSFLRDRRAEVVSQLRLGLLQIPEDRLTDVGKYVVGVVESEVERQEAELGPLRLPLPRPMAEHLARWMGSNPDLAHRVKLPDDADGT